MTLKKLFFIPADCEAVSIICKEPGGFGSG